jgi:shikimate kinase
MNLILIGYRASGKTSVGKRLSGLLRRPFYDTDALIREETGKTVKEIVLEEGWPAFRDAEKTVIADLAGEEGAVIALGGGAVLDRANVEVLKPRGFFIWLQAGKETIRERLRTDGATAEQRPPLPSPRNGDDEEILKQRVPIYGALADLAVDTTGRSIEEVAEEILVAIDRRNLNAPSPCPLPQGERVSSSKGKMDSLPLDGGGEGRG